MAASKPFRRGGITYPSQYAYRQALAARRGYDSPRAMYATMRRMAAEQPVLGRLIKLGAVDGDNAEAVYTEMQAFQRQQHVFVPGRPVAPLYPALDAAIRSLGPDAYSIWRQLYRG